MTVKEENLYQYRQFMALCAFSVLNAEDVDDFIYFGGLYRTLANNLHRAPTQGEITSCVATAVSKKITMVYDWRNR